MITVSAVERFKMAATDPKMQGPTQVGEARMGPPIDYFGASFEYEAATHGQIIRYVKLIRKNSWAVVLGLTQDGFVLTQANYKPGVDRVEWSLAPGGIGRVSPEASAEEILPKVQEGYLRETGYGEGEWMHLGTETIDSGSIRGSSVDGHGCRVHMYLATGLVELGDSKPNITETIRLIPVPLAELGKVIDSGLFDECSSLTCLLLAERRLRKLGLLSAE